MHHAGIDVSARTLDVSLTGPSGTWEGQFSNDPKGHAAAIKILGKHKPVRVVLEATSTYGLDFAMRLHQADGIEVMILNPRLAANFAKALNARGKTDQSDARVLREYAASRPFVPWVPPARDVLQLRQFSRAMQDLVAQRTQEKNRVHAMERTQETNPLVLQVTRAHIKQLDEHIKQLQKAALDIVGASPTLRRRFDLLDSIPGVATTSALYILAELACLPADLDVRQLVAHAGLDPRPWQSGTSIQGKTRISKRGNKHLRHALYMPAVHAARKEPTVSAYAAQIEKRLKKRTPALIAVMRKLLHSIVGMFRTDTAFDPRRFRALSA